MKASKTFLVVGVISSLAACGGGDGGLSPTEAFESMAQTLCERAFECEATSPEPLEYANVDACVTDFTADLGEDQAEMEASIEAGRISWNEADAAYCLGQVKDALNGLSCDVFWDEALNALSFDDDPRCENLGEGLVADGDACTIDDDCAAEGSACIDLVCGQPQ